MECISKVKKTWRLNFLPLPSTRRFELTCKKGEKKTTLGCGGGGGEQGNKRQKSCPSQIVLSFPLKAGRHLKYLASKIHKSRTAIYVNPCQN